MPTAAVIAAGIMAAGAGFMILFGGEAREMYEDASYALDPSAERAFSYGERHLDSANRDTYDFGRAESYLLRAAAKDPSLPYIYHELARLRFLKGDLGGALGFIDAQISLHGTSTPNSYYVRGLIEGYMGRYDDAAQDYARYLAVDPKNWAALNDFAWVLLKSGRFSEAAGAAALGLSYTPSNPWLLNSYAIASHELGHDEEALRALAVASSSVQSMTEREWLTAYPGNDPRVVPQGIGTLKKSIIDNIHTIAAKAAAGAVQ
jgi:tetratricopeptide (TPR) repeat protein